MPTAHLELIDWLIIGSWFEALLLIGLYYRRFAGQSLDHFFLGGRRNTGWANGLSYAAAMLNADVAPAYSGLAAVTGVFICWWYLSRFGLAFFLGAMLFAVFWRRLNLFTTPEFYELRFGGLASNVIRTWVALRSSLVAMVAWTGTGLLAMHKLAQPILRLDTLPPFQRLAEWLVGVNPSVSPQQATEFVGKTTTLVLVLPMVLIYTALSGFSGVVATSAIHNLIMFVGSGLLCGIVLYQLGGPGPLAAALEKMAGPQALDALPPSEHAVFPLAAAVAWMIGSSIGYGGDTAPLGGAMEGQCLQASKNTREASKMYIAAAVTLFVLLLLVTLPALGAGVEWPGLRDGTIDREQTYGLLMVKYLPAGLLGLVFVVMLASVMGTVSSNLNFGGQVLVNDVYRRYVRRHVGDRHYLWIGRLAALVILGLALLVVYNVALIYDVAVFMVQFSAAELPANWAQWWWWRFNSWGRLAASFGAPTFLILVRSLRPDWHWWDQMYLVIALNTALWVTMTLATPPDRPEILARFYRKARPLGAWGWVRQRIAAEEIPSPTAENAGTGLILTGLLLAILGACSVMLLVLAISHFYVAQVTAALGELVGCTLAGSIFLKSYGPFLDRLERRAPVVTEVPVPGALSERTGAEPAPTGVVVAVATGAYGVLIIVGGFFFTEGSAMLWNAVAGLGLVVCAGAVWWLQDGKGKEGQ